MEDKGYVIEAKYISIIRNWRRASDERGQTDDQRHQFNKDLLCYILDDLMPWHKDEGLRDYSVLEVNRYVNMHAVIYINFVIMYICLGVSTIYKDLAGKPLWLSLLILNPGNGDADFAPAMVSLLSTLVQAPLTMWSAFSACYETALERLHIKRSMYLHNGITIECVV